jgi:ABC-type multidrug transport system fused ATPase/permease subunit
MLQYLSKVLYILPASNRKLLFLLSLFILVSGLETFGIGLVGPFLALANNPGLLHEHAFSKILVSHQLFDSEKHLVAILGGFIVIVFIIKSYISWRVKTYVFRFSFEQRGKLCLKLAHSYLNAPYVYHLSKSSPYIIQSISSDTNAFVNGILLSLLDTLSSLIIILSLSLLVSWSNILAVIVILAIFIPLFLLFHHLRDKIRFWGKQLSRSGESILRVVNHGFGGIKETQVIGCSSYFASQLYEHVQEYEDAGASLFEIKLLPRIIIETALIVIIVGFTSSSLLVGGNLESLIPSLGIFALASLRLMPAVTQVLNGTNSLRSNSFVLNKIYADLKDLNQVEAVQQGAAPPLDNRNPDSNLQVFEHRQQIAHPFHDRIQLEGVYYQYPKADDLALNNIKLTIHKGESIALIGKSGAGKTTLVDVILGLLVPQQGDITLDGMSIYKDLRSWQNLIGYIPQFIYLMDDTIERNIAFGVPDALIDQQRLYYAIQAAQLSELILELPDGMKTRLGERGVRLSGGQRQRIGIARALYHEREILVLDEATSALDNETESLVTQSIQALSGLKTLIIIAHRLTTIEHCDRVYQLEKGSIIKSGSYQEVA